MPNSPCPAASPSPRGSKAQAVHKPLKQRQQEAAWRQARLELLRAYDGRSDAVVEQELAQAKSDGRTWEIFSLEKEQRQRAEWLQTFLEADGAWLQTALVGKKIPPNLHVVISSPLRSKGLEHLLPTPQTSALPKPRF